MNSNTRIVKRITRSLISNHWPPSGSFGQYFQISRKKGIKLLHGEYRDVQDAVQSSSYKCACEELKSLKMAKRLFPYIPKCYGIKVIKVNKEYKVGIVLQHLGSMRISQMPEGKERYAAFDTMWGLEKRIKELGIAHNDIHSCNAMYFKRRVWIIDFGGVTVNPITNGKA